MTSGPTLDILWDDLVRFSDRYYPGWRGTDLIYYSNALAGEVGEFCNAVKHACGGGTRQAYPTDGELAEELVDSFIYLVMAVERINAGRTGFAEAVVRKIEKNRARMEARRTRPEGERDI